MRTRPFKQVDVFTHQPYLGNPLAVVLDGNDLNDDDLQRFARWTNLSETSFLLPPTHPSADYRVRIFTPGGELPFAGHPTLGSCHSWLQSGGQPRNQDFVIQECEIGLVKIRREPTLNRQASNAEAPNAETSNSEAATERLAFAAPDLQRSQPSPVLLSQIAAALGLNQSQIVAAQLLDNGPVWFGLLLDSPETVLQLTPNHQMLIKLNRKVGVASFYETTPDTPLIARANREARAFNTTAVSSTAPLVPELEVRAFAAPIGIEEDPVTGSLNASLAQWLMAEGHAPERYLATQGACLGRAGQVYIERDAAGQVWVGGETVTCVNGQVML